MPPQIASTATLVSWVTREMEESSHVVPVLESGYGRGLAGSEFLLRWNGLCWG